MKSLGIILICLGFVFSCKKDKVVEAPVDVGYRYFPDFMGKYIVYDVDSIAYRAIQNDTIHAVYRIKEQLDSLFTDNQGRPTYRVTRYIKNYNPQVSYDSIAWTIKDVWALNVTSTNVQRDEENITYVKLIFPVSINATWDGNAHNNLGEQNYKYTEINGQFSYGGTIYDSVLTVTQKSASTALGKHEFFEKYAKGVGMVYKEISDYDFKVINGVLQPGIISEGIIYKMNIIEHN